MKFIYLMMHSVLCLYLGCSTSVYKFWHWGFGTWVKWCSEAVEMDTERTKSKWKGNCWFKACSLSFSSFIFCVFLLEIFLSWRRFLKSVCLKATANVVPQHWQPNSGLLMANDVSGVNLEESVPCIALSKNDSYVMSACGGKVSLFNMMTFKVSHSIHVLQT